ncbi:hypothetical protein [Brevibacillus migulae]|uniref:hypothetical protein n=1 Tax=Brevibacillus migulae TaxID=1644114 RepID=UPI00106E12E0|nr:hypothetical protein [Brevibacillus migulae]
MVTLYVLLVTFYLLGFYTMLDMLLYGRTLVDAIRLLFDMDISTGKYFLLFGYASGLAVSAVIDMRRKKSGRKWDGQPR